jgi:hypothetical protein
MQAKLLRGKVLPTMRLTFRFFFHGLTICRLTSGNVYVKINVIRSTGLFNPCVDGRRGQSIQACQRQSCWPTSEYQHIKYDTLAFFLFFKCTLTINMQWRSGTNRQDLEHEARTPRLPTVLFRCWTKFFSLANLDDLQIGQGGAGEPDVGIPDPLESRPVYERSCKGATPK